jgi:hypothetical protein
MTLLFELLSQKFLFVVPDQLCHVVTILRRWNLTTIHSSARRVATGPARAVDVLENWQAANVSVLVGFFSGDECRKVGNTLRRGRPLSECRAALGTHEQNPGAVKCNVREGVAVLASYLTLLSAFCQGFIERHTVAFSEKARGPQDPTTRSLRRPVKLIGCDALR